MKNKSDRRGWFPLLLVATLLVTPAFGEEDAAARVETNGGFKPSIVEVNVGDDVEWVNTSAMTHTVTADARLAKDPSNVALPEGAAPFHSGAIRPGATFRHTFTVAGRYRYLCIPHEKHGMIGEVIVR